MRVLAVMLSVYILVMSGIPCNDNHDTHHSSGDIRTEIAVDLHGHDAADLCNPFFFCHAGHHTFVSGEFNSSHVKTDFSEISIINPQNYHYSVAFSIWNPPKA